jgi:hypothetical protein
MSDNTATKRETRTDLRYGLWSEITRSGKLYKISGDKSMIR